MDNMKTDRLIIRRFREEDGADLHQYLSDERVVKYEPYEVYTEEKSRQEAKDRAQMEYFWAVCLKDTGKLIGNIYFNQNGPKEFNTYEMGYVFNANYWGNGYATEACRAFLSYAFQTLHAHRVTAECNPLNENSWKLLERLNMRREALMLKNIFFKKDENGNAIWCDTYVYSMLDSEFN